MGNLKGMFEYLVKQDSDFCKSRIKGIGEEKEEEVVIRGEHWRFYIYMVSGLTDLEIDDGYCVNQFDIEFFNNVYQDIENISDIYHKRKIGFNYM